MISVKHDLLFRSFFDSVSTLSLMSTKSYALDLESDLKNSLHTDELVGTLWIRAQQYKNHSRYKEK